MSCLQLTVCGTAIVANVSRPQSLSSVQYVSTRLCSCTYPRLTLKTSTKNQYSIVCLFGGKGKRDDGEASPWKSLEKAMGGFRKDQSIEDVLRKQIEKQEYFDDGGNGGSPPLGGGGGGGGGFGESEDEDSAMGEFLQVILATIGFIFLYMYILDGEEMTLVAKDFIRLLFTRRTSIRLQRVLSGWETFFKRMTKKKKKKVTPQGWLEYAIVNTPTWYDSPEKYRRISSQMASSESDY